MRQQGKPVLARAPQQAMLPAGAMESDVGRLVGAGATMMQTTVGYQTAIAVQKPRDVTVLTKSVIDEAGMAGEDFYYVWTVENRRTGDRSLIEGIGIDGTMILARHWGNCAMPTKLVQDAPQFWVFECPFIDLESGFTVQRLFRQRKNQQIGRFDDDRAQDIQFQIGQSKAIRNAVLAGIPTWLQKRALEAAKATAEGKYSDVVKMAPKVIEAFQRIGVTVEQLERKLGRPRDTWEPRDLASLSAIGRAIKDRQTTVASEFSTETPVADTDHDPEVSETLPVESAPNFGGTPQGVV